MNKVKNSYGYYNRILQPYANRLRKRMTKSEASLWKYALRAGMRKGFTFRRQRPVLDYIADFMCKELMLIIEVDGKSHSWKEVMERDVIRENRLKNVGFFVLRFTDEEVLRRMNWVIEQIDLVIDDIRANSNPPPAPRQPRRVKRKE